MPPQLEISLLSAEGLIEKRMAASLQLPGKTGSVTILPGHSPLFIYLTAGPLIFDQKEKTSDTFWIDEGIAEIRPNQVILLVIPQDRKVT